MLAYQGEIWLPNIKCINKYISKYLYLLEPYFTITLTKEVYSNPLVLATENITDVLTNNNPNPFINKNQLVRLDNKFPFYRLVFNK